MRFNRKVVAGLAITALVVAAVKPALLVAVLPLLLMVACPLSMLLMMRAMPSASNRSGDARHDDPPKDAGHGAHAEPQPTFLVDEIARLRAELRNARAENAAFKEQAAEPTPESRATS